MEDHLTKIERVTSKEMADVVRAAAERGELQELIALMENSRALTLRRGMKLCK